MKEKGRARAFDFLVLASICAAVALAALGAKKLLYSESRESDDIVYVVEISELDDGLCKNVTVGEELLSANTKRSLGKITSIRIFPAYRELYSEKYSTVISSAVPGKSRVVITVEAKGERDGGITVGGTRLRVGETVNFRARELFFEGEVEKIIL